MIKLTEASADDYNSFCRCIRENGLVLSDLDHLFWNPFYKIAKDLGMEKEYNAFVKGSSMNYESIASKMPLIKGYDTEGVSDLLRKTKLFSGSRESIQTFKDFGLKVGVVTDNPFAEVWKNNQIIRDKLNVSFVRSTCDAKIRDGKYTGELLPSKNRTKPKIVDYFIATYKPKRLFGMVQGENDIPFAESLKAHRGYVFVFNSNSAKLSEMADIHIESIKEAPKIIEEVLKGL